MTTKQFPDLYQVSSKGKMKLWRIWVESTPQGALIKEQHGFDDGKLIDEVILVDKGKNIGKANETTPFEQATSEAQSKWNKKIDKGYTKDGKAPTNDIIFPMLAQSFTKSKHRIVYPCFTQPKLNGVRCVHTTKYQSRLGKYWETLSHLDKDVERIQQAVGVPLDGEAYIHGLNLQDIGALIKKERLDDDQIEGYKTEDLEYWIYDTVDTKTNFKERNDRLKEAFVKAGAEEFEIEGVPFMRLGKLVYVGTFFAASEIELVRYKRAFIEAEFEGGMARNDVPYVLCPGNHHCADLQKLKDFFDAEFKIIGGKEGVGRDKGCVTFKLEMNGGIEFEAKPMGTVKQRKRWFKDIKSIIGTMATVRYQEFTKDNKPFHGRVIAIRDYE